jgi:hypothetical protein
MPIGLNAQKNHYIKEDIVLKHQNDLSHHLKSTFDQKKKYVAETEKRKTWNLQHRFDSF